MKTRAIPKSGERLPVVGLGTYRTFDVRLDDESRARLIRVLEVLFETGGTVIDSSPMYGRSEDVVGELLASMKARDKAFLATKVWTSGERRGIQQMEQSLTRFRTKSLELMQIHNLVDWKTQLKTLRAWKEQGRFRYIGITHYTTSAFDELASVLRAEPMDFLQIPYNIADREAERALLPLAKDKGVAVLPNVPFGQAGLFGRVRDKTLPSWAAEFDCTSWAQFFLKYLLGDDAVTCVIPGTSKPHHMEDNAQAGMGALPDAKTRARMAQYIEAL